MQQFKTKAKAKPTVKRPEVKTVSLSPEALQIYEKIGHNHNWSEEISNFLVGRYGTGLTPEGRIHYLQDSIRGYSVYYERRLQALEAERERILRSLTDELGTWRQEFIIQQNGMTIKRGGEQ